MFIFRDVSTSAVKSIAEVEDTHYVIWNCNSDFIMEIKDEKYLSRTRIGR